MKKYETSIKATFDPTQKQKFNGKIRDKQIYKGYQVIDSDFNIIVDCRIYWPSQTAYCAIWVSNYNEKGYCSTQNSGTGSAGGYGYCKESAAVGDAIDSAGYTLSKDIDGRGISAIKEALVALANTVNRKNKYLLEFFG